MNKDTSEYISRVANFEFSILKSEARIRQSFSTLFEYEDYECDAVKQYKNKCLRSLAIERRIRAYDLHEIRALKKELQYMKLLNMTLKLRNYT